MFQGNEFPELKMLLLCLRWPQRAEDGKQIAQLANQPLDWALFLKLVRHHRVMPLVARNLLRTVSAGSVQPEEASAAFAELARASQAGAFQSLHTLAELRRLTQELEAAGIRIRVLKGLPLAQMIYGDIALRSAGDIDVMISEADLLPADRLLRRAGYSATIDLARLSSGRLAFYCAHWKDVTYPNLTRDFEVDLHWRCFRNPRMPGAELCSAAPCTVSFGGFAAETLPPTEALLHVCVHGSLDGWLYFKSLADVAAGVRGMSEAELDELAAAASRYSVLPELSAALCMVRRYLAMDCWSSRLLPEDDRTVSHILGYADRVLVRPRYLASREAVPIWATLRFEFGLRRSWRYRRELALRVLFRPRMWQSIPLPDALFWLYPLLSPFEWLFFRWRGTVAK